MKVEKFTQEELEYINADIYDASTGIYAYRCWFGNDPKHLGIQAKNLPKGSYYLDIPKARCIVNPREPSERYMNYLRQDHNMGIYTTLDGIQIDVGERSANEIEMPFFPGDIKSSVISLRKQAILNKHYRERLIAKAIKTHTNYGEDYNRESFCDTVMDCMIEGEDLIVDESKSIADPDVKYLRFMQLLQLSHKLDAEQEALNKRKAELKLKSDELMKY